MTVRANILQNQPDFWCTFSITEGPVFNNLAGRGLTGAYIGVGVYDFTLDEGGCDITNCILSPSMEVPVGFFVRVRNQTDTIKRVTLTDSANAPVEATAGNLAIWIGKGTV